MTGPVREYAAFEAVTELRRELAELIRRQLSVVRALHSDAYRERWSEQLVTLVDTVEASHFKVLVLGQFSRGKSTFINALLGRKVLPTYATATTAVLNEVKFGERPQAVLYPRPSPEDPGPAPFEVPVEQLEDYIVVDEDDPMRPNRYLRADVFWPIELCRNGVQMVDSPGLQDLNVAREEETIGYLPRVDAVIVMLDAQQGITRTEMDFFTNVVRPLGHEDAFWVVNKINLVHEDAPRVVRAVRRALEPLVTADRRIFFVDARGALEAKERGDAEALAQSGLPEVERALQEFLTVHRGRAKVLAPVRRLQLSVHEVAEAIRVEEELLAEDYEGLAERAHRSEVPLARAEKTAGHISVDLRRRLDDLLEEAEEAAADYYGSLPGRVAELLGEVPVETALSLDPRQLRSRADAVVAELVRGLQGRIAQDNVSWRQGTLERLITTRLEGIQHAIRDELRDFEEQLRRLRLNLATRPSVTAEDDEDLVLAEGTQSVTINVGWMGAGTVTLGAVAGGLGGLAAAIAVSILGLGAIAPFVVIPAILFSIGDRWSPSQFKEKVLRAIRGKIVTAAGRQLHERQQELVNDVRTDVRTRLDAVYDEFVSRLTVQVAGLREEVESALHERREGEARVAARKQEIRAAQAELRAIDTIVDRLLALDRDLTLPQASSSPEAPART